MHFKEYLQNALFTFILLSGVARGGQVGASAPGRQGSGVPKWGLKSFINFILYFDELHFYDPIFHVLKFLSPLECKKIFSSPFKMAKKIIPP